MPPTLHLAHRHSLTRNVARRGQDNVNDPDLDRAEVALIA